MSKSKAIKSGWQLGLSNLDNAALVAYRAKLTEEGYSISTGGQSQFSEGTAIQGIIDSITSIINMETKQALLLANVTVNHEGKVIKDTITLSGSANEAQVGDTIFGECRMNSKGQLRNSEITEDQYLDIVEELEPIVAAPAPAPAPAPARRR